GRFAPVCPGLGLADKAYNASPEIANKVFGIKFRNIKFTDIEVSVINGICRFLVGSPEQVSYSHVRLEEFGCIREQRLAGERGSGDQANEGIVGSFFCIQHLAGAPE